MIRLGTALLVIALSAPSLLAAARIATPNASSPVVEAVNWTAGVSYSYDGSGNITAIGDDRFAYDRVGRLTQAEVNDVTRVYSYDALGNRTGCTHEPDKPEQSDCQFGIGIDSASNRMKDVKYDASGNAEEFAGHRYTYDAVDMPVRDERGGAAREFVYTAEDERIAIVNGSSWQWAVRDLDGRVLREFTSNGAAAFTWSRDYVYRDGQLLASRHVANTTPVTYHYHLDHLGTARRITDHNNRIVGFHDYFAFGPEIFGSLTEPSPTSIQYTGHERDKGGAGGMDTLDYMLARYYSPAMGRFLSVDPAGNFDYTQPQSFNRYAYAGNDPINFVDPDGQTKKIFGWIVKYIGKRHIKIKPVFSNKQAARALRQNKQVDVARRQQAVSSQRPNSKGKRPVKDDAHPDKKTGSLEGRYPHAHASDRSGGHANWSNELVGAVVGVALSAFNLDADEADPVQGHVLNEQYDMVAIWVFGKSFGELTPDERKEVSDVFSGRTPLPDRPHEKDPTKFELPPAGACIPGPPECR